MEAYPSSPSKELTRLPCKAFASKEAGRRLDIVNMRLDVGLSADEDGFTLCSKNDGSDSVQSRG